jgi:hypothetical protein
MFVNTPLRRRCPRVAEALAEAQALAQALGDGGNEQQVRRYKSFLWNTLCRVGVQDNFRKRFPKKISCGNLQEGISRCVFKMIMNADSWENFVNTPLGDGGRKSYL